MRRLALALLFSSLALPLRAQSSELALPVMREGDRVRIVAPGFSPPWVTGFVDSLTPSDLVLSASDGTIYSVPLIRIREIHMSKGRSWNKRIRSAVLAGLVGLAGGATVRAVAQDKSDSDTNSRLGQSNAVVGHLPQIGAGAGIVFGLVSGGEYWKRVYPVR